MACLATPRIAWADGGCSGCFDSSDCVWVCVVTLGFVAIPLWLVGMSAAVVFIPKLRRVRPHLVALPVAYFGAWLTVTILPTTLIAAPIPLLAWYVAVMKLDGLAGFRRLPR